MTTSNSTEAASQAEAAAVAALTRRVVAAWAYHDARSFADAFVEDATMILPGAYRKGREEIAAYMEQAFAGKWKGTQVTGSPLDIRFITPDTGILVTAGGVLNQGETEVADPRAVHAQWTVVKRDGEWMLAAYQNSPRYDD